MNSPRKRLVLAAVVAVIGTTIVMSGQPSTADVTAAQGLAFNYTLNVGIFGGPPEVRGFGQTIPPGSVSSASPSVTCPPGGGTATATDPDGARGSRGPDTIYGGIWPPANNTAPPSGPQTSSITCQLGPNGFVTASTDVVLNPPGTTWTTPGGTVESWPGGVGPDPFHADSVHSECRADETGRSGSTTIVTGQVVTSTDPITGEPATVVNIPTNPAPNTIYHGTLDHINPSGPDENFDLIINEQILNPDGSITVSAAHMFRNGPIVVGEMIIGSVTCGPLTIVTTSSTSSTSTSSSTTSTSTPTSSSTTSTSTSSTSTSTSSTSTTSTSTSTTSTTVPGPPQCNGLVATIVGTSGNNMIVGTPGNDVIVGLGGYDSIQGLGSNDTICGGEGNDQIDGGAGNDTIFGGNGNDRLLGGSGNNALFGEGGTDQCFVTPTSTAQTCEQVLPQS